MRKLIVSNIMSLDGYYEGPGKNVMDLFAYRWDYPTDESFDTYNVQRLRAADTLLLGRVSYEGFKRRRHAPFRRSAESFTSAHRHTHVG
jgi:hypothetical protein